MSSLGIAARALGMLLLFATLARAQDPAQARVLFQQGLDAAQQQRWADAVGLFRQSRAIVDRPSTVYNLALALQSMGQSREALRALDDYLRLTDPSDERYQDAQNLRPQIQASIGRLALTFSPANAQVEIDGEVDPGSGSPREIDLDAGDHALRVSADGYRPDRARVNIRGGATVTHQSMLVAEGGAAASAPPGASHGIGGTGVIGLVLGAAGVALGAGSLITGLVANGANDGLASRCGPTGQSCPPGSEGDISFGSAMAWTSTILLGAAVLTAAIGVTLFILDLASGPPAERAQARIGIRGTSLELEGSL